MNSRLINIFAIAISILIANKCNSWKLMVQINWRPHSAPFDSSNQFLIQLRATNSNWQISSEKCALFADNYDLVTFLSEKHFPNLLDEFGRQMHFLMDIKIGDKLAANIRVKGVNKILTYSLSAQKLIEEIPYSDEAAIGKAFPQRILQFIFQRNLPIWLLKIQCRIEGQLAYEIIQNKKKDANLMAKGHICPGNKYTLIYAAKENTPKENFELDCGEASYEPNLVNKYRIELPPKSTMPKAHSSFSADKNKAICSLESQFLRISTFQPEIKLHPKNLEIFVEILQKIQRNARKILGGFQVPGNEIGASEERGKGAEGVKALMKMVSTSEYQWGKEAAFNYNVDSEEDEKIEKEKAVETNEADEKPNEAEQRRNKGKFVMEEESPSQPKLKMMKISPKEGRHSGCRALNIQQQKELIQEYEKNAPNLRKALAHALTRNVSNRYGGLAVEMRNSIHSAILYLFKFHGGILSISQISKQLKMGQSANYVRSFLRKQQIYIPKRDKGVVTISENEMKFYKEEIRNHLKNVEGHWQSNRGEQKEKDEEMESENLDSESTYTDKEEEEEEYSE